MGCFSLLAAIPPQISLLLKDNLQAVLNSHSLHINYKSYNRFELSLPTSLFKTLSKSKSTASFLPSLHSSFSSSIGFPSFFFLCFQCFPPPLLRFVTPPLSTFSSIISHNLKKEIIKKSFTSISACSFWKLPAHSKDSVFHSILISTILWIHTLITTSEKQ